jgi:hypothetical protein
MPALKHISRQAIVGLWLFICLAPFGWILFVSENRWAWIKLWPILPGMVVTVLSRSISHSSGSISLPLSAIVSLAISATVLFLMLRTSHSRIVVAMLALMTYCFFSWYAYQLYLL